MTATLSTGFWCFPLFGAGSEEVVKRGLPSMCLVLREAFGDGGVRALSSVASGRIERYVCGCGLSLVGELSIPLVVYELRVAEFRFDVGGTW
uniref:Uncharacterized protein n=1 Tax=Arundo donax TaxID=35708 RepID=A0A0A8XN07_ARUDO